MASADIEAGRAHIVLALKDKIGQQLQSIEKKLAGFGSSISSIGTSMMGAGSAAAAGFGAVGLAIGGAALAFADAGSKFADMAARTGVSGSSLSALAYAADQSGTSIDAVEGAVKKMQATLGDAANGSTAATEKLAALGLSFDQLKALSPDQQFAAISAKIAEIQDPTLRAAAAMDIFGKAGTNILPLITSDINAAIAEARQLGLVMSEEDIAAADALGDSFAKLKSAIGAVINAIGAAVAGPLTQFFESATQGVAIVGQFISANRGLVVAIGGIAVAGAAAGVAVAALGATFVAVGAMISATSVIVGAASAAMGAISSVVATVGAPVIAAVAAVVGLFLVVGGVIAYVMYQSGLASQAIAGVSAALAPLAAIATSAFGSITQALQAGQYTLAAKLLWSALKLAFFVGADQVLQTFKWLYNNAMSISTTFFNTLMTTAWNVFKAIPKLLMAALKGGQSFAEVLAKALSGDNKIGDVATSQIDQARAEFEKLQAEAKTAFDASQKSKQSGSAAAGQAPDGQAMQPPPMPGVPAAAPPSALQGFMSPTLIAGFQGAAKVAMEPMPGQPALPGANQAANNGPDEVGKAMAAYRAQVEREDAARKAQADQLAPSMIAATDSSPLPKTEARGTFSAAAAMAFGGGSDAMDQVANNTSKGNRLLQRLIDKPVGAFS